MTYWVVNGCILLVLVALCAITPYVIRKNDVFGVYFPDSASQLEKVRSMRRLFFLLCVSTGLVCAAFWFLAVWLRLIHRELAFTIAMLAYLLFQSLLYLLFHFRAKRMKQNHEFSYTVQKQVAVDFSPEPRFISRWWFAPHVLLVAVTAGVTAWREPALGEWIPIHWDYLGTVTLTENGFLSLYQLVLLQVFLVVLFYVLLMMTARSKKVIRSDDPQASRRASYRFKKLWCAYLIAIGFFTIALIGLLQFAVLELCPFSWVLPGIAVFSILSGVPALVLVFYTGQGGSRLLRIDSRSDAIDPREDDRYWKLGCLYYNPDDPSLMVEKRFGIGWTMNMARPAAWVILAVLLVMLAAGILAACFSA